MRTEDHLRGPVLLSLQRGLLGEIPPALRGVAVDWDARHVRIVGYFDGPISEEDRESMSVVETEVIADFPDMVVTTDLVRRDAPTPLDWLRAVAYSRRETG